MDADERDVVTYLKGWRDQFVSYKEIARRAGGKHRYRYDPDWAVPVLARLVERRLVESDSTGHYRLPPVPKKEQKKWLSPQVRKALEASGKNFDGVFEVDKEDEDL